MVITSHNMSMAPTTGSPVSLPAPQTHSSRNEQLLPSSSHHSSQLEETRTQAACL
uniref:Uncharacterized protein n=1 Tax=Setaria italica TaxID=4555 RepID=K3ZPV2_SETIT